MAISTISPQFEVQGLPGTSKLVFSKKSISTAFFASDATEYSNNTATYYLNSGVYAIVSAATNSTSFINIYNEATDEFLVEEAFASDFASFKYFEVEENNTAKINIYFTTGAISINIFEVKV